MFGHDRVSCRSLLTSNDAAKGVETVITDGRQAALLGDQHPIRQDRPLTIGGPSGRIGDAWPGRFNSLASTTRAWPELLTRAYAAFGSPTATVPATRIRILIAIAVRLYREGLSEMLGSHEGFTVVALAADTDSALLQARQLRPDIVFLDISMPDGLGLAHALAKVAPGAAVVATAVAETDSEIVACAEAGVAGFITRDQSLAEAVRVLESVACGESACSPRTAAALLRRVRLLNAQRKPPGPPDGLTPRESEIARLIARGHSNKEIARELCIELSTVKNHVHHVLEKLGVRGRAEAATRVQAHLSA